MPYDPQQYQQWLGERRARNPITSQGAPRPASSAGGGVVGDILAAPFRGIEGAAQDAWGLLDTIAFDALPDYDERFLGESKTVAGGLVEGMTNFLAGFIPVAGVMTKVGRVAKIGRTLGLVKGAAKAPQLTILGDLAAGAIADSVVWSKQDSNLAALIESVPALANPVTDFLAIDEDDSEIQARMKTVLEGVGLGAMMEPFLAALRAYRSRHASTRAGKTPDAIAAELADSTDFGTIERGLSYRAPDEPLSLSENFWVTDPSITSPQKLTKDGTIVGSPKLTPESVAPIQRLMVKAARQGEVARFWYEDSSRAIREITGGNLEDADKLAKALAILSPKTGVQPNAMRAMQAFHIWKRGVSVEEFLSRAEYNLGTGDQMKRLARALWGVEDGGVWYGRKTFNFYRNLMREVDPQLSQGVTVDMWMARLYGFESDTVSGRGYDFIQRQVEEVSDALGWEPHQTQAALWTYSKALWEAKEPSWRAAAKEAGITTTVVGPRGVTSASPEYAKFQRARFRETLARDLNGGTSLRPQDTYSFLQGLASRPLRLSYEPLPATFPFEEVPVQARLSYAQERTAAMYDPKTGLHEVSQAVGWGPVGMEAPASSVSLPSTTVKGGEASRTVEASTRELSRKWAYLNAVLLGQREVFMVRTFEGAPTSSANGIAISLGRPVTTNDTLEALHLMEVIGVDPEGVRAFAQGDSVYFARLDGEPLGLSPGSANRLLRAFDETPVSKELWDTAPQQEFPSAATDVNRTTGTVPAVFKKATFKPNTVNVDIGGGRGAAASAYLEGRKVKNVVFDPFALSAKANARAAAVVSGGRADTATISNVLNVIREPGNRDRVIRQAADAIKPDGTAYFKIHEGARDGVGGPTASGWQENRRAQEYADEVRRWFNKVERKGDMLVATGPKLGANPERVAHMIRQSLTEDLLKPEFKAAAAKKYGTARRVCGHCYTASEAAYHTMGGAESGWVPAQVSHEGISHWFLRNRETGEILDITADQFSTPVPYENAVNRGFLTSKPSKRAAVLMDRAEARRTQQRTARSVQADIIHDFQRTPEGLRQQALNLGYGSDLERLEPRVSPRIADADSRFGVASESASGFDEPKERVVFLRDPDGAEQSIEAVRSELEGAARGASAGTPGPDGALFGDFVADLERDVQIGAFADPEDIATIREFVRRVGSNLFAGVGLRTTMGSRASSYNFASRVVTLGVRAIREGNIKRDTLHELWHHLSANLEPRWRKAIDDAYQKDLAQALDADPSLAARIADKRKRIGTDAAAPVGAGLGEQDYKYLSVHEWFAETMTERTMAKLDLFDAADQPGIRGLIAHARLWWTEVVNGLRARFGGDRTQLLLDDFLRGRRSVSMADYYAPHTGATAGKVFNDPDTRPAPAAVLRHLGIDETKAEEIAAKVKTRIDGGRDPKLNPRNLTAHELIEEELRRGDLNLSRWGGREDGLALMRVVEDLYHGFMETDVASLNRPQSFDEQTAAALAERAEIIGDDPATAAAKWQAEMSQDQSDLRRAISRIYAHKTLLSGMSDELGAVADRINLGQATKEEMAEFAQNLQFYSEMVASMKGLTGEVGRGLGFMRRSVVPFRDIELSKRELDLIVESQGGTKSIEKLAEQFSTALGDGGKSGVAAATRVVQATWRSTGVSIFNEYWINSILSGPRTLIVNIMSGAFMSFYRPMELMLGGAMHNVFRGGGSDAFGEGFEELTRLMNLFSEDSRMAVRMSRRAKNSGEPILTGRNLDDRPMHQRNAIVAENFGVAGDTGWGKAINWLGHKVRLPTRIMAQGDEYIKQMSYRAVAQTHFSRQGRLAGLTGQDLADHVVGEMDKLIYEGQAYSKHTLFRRGMEEGQTRGLADDELREFASKYAKDNFDEDMAALSQFARDAAEEITFSRPMEPGSLASGLQKLVNAHPMMRLILPFIRTPVNIAGFAHQRLNPVYLAQGLVAVKWPDAMPGLANSRSKIVQGLLSADKREQAQAMGRLTAGLGFFGLGTSMAMSGVITGRGPSDPQQRRVLEAEGWLPYSIKTKNGYLQYNRLDPFATVLGVFADVTDYLKYAPPTNDAPVMNAVLVALANNFTNKTYLTGIRNAVEALTDPDRHAERWVHRTTASLVPNVLGQGVAAVDADMREVRSLVDAIIAKVPGLSDTLAPQRNVLGETVKRLNGVDYDSLKGAGLGEAVATATNWWQPIMYRSTSDDAIAKEMASLGHGWTPPKVEVSGMLLTDFRSPSGQDAYDRWGELQGTIRINGKTLRQTLRRLFDSEGYQKMSPESTVEADSPRIRAITNVITRYRRRAFSDLKKEFPDLAEAERQIFQQRRYAKYGDRARRLLTETR